MGWKNVKEAYRIGHTVQVTPAGICIGSPYIHNIIVIGLDGKIVKRDHSGVNEDLVRYQLEMDSDPDRLRQLVRCPDTFTKSEVIYTFDEGEILEKLCENAEYGSVTHDGKIICEGSFSTDKGKVVAAAKRNAEFRIKSLSDRIEESREQLGKYEQTLSEVRAQLKELDTEFPLIPAGR